jgi:GAF domain-containing protein
VLTGADAISSLLDRLRTAVGADGIALVQIGGFRPRLFWAGEGLQPQPASTQSHAGTAGERLGRTVLIHNDAARVGEMSAARWPPDVLSLISVPVLRGGETHAVIEVAYLRGRRSTEWEIALIQVAAARAAGLLKDESYAKTGAVA